MKEENFNFECKKCGDCCRFGYKNDISGNVVCYTGVTLDKDEKEKYKGYHKRHHNRRYKYYQWFLKWNEDNSCIFLENNKCKVHSDKPKVCKDYTCINPYPKESDRRTNEEKKAAIERYNKISRTK